MTISLNLNKFNYGEIRRVEDSVNGRRYLDESNKKIASVTTILSKTKDTTGLDEWRARIGDKKADQEMLESSALGTMMHTHLENYILGEPRPGGTNQGRILAKNMADLIIYQGLIDVDDVLGVEAPLMYDTLWAGTADLIGYYRGKMSIMDFKTTKKPKKLEYVQDYFLQLSAYCLAHDRKFGTKIERGVIFMASRDLQYQQFVIQGDELEEYKVKWCERVSQYYATRLFEDQ